MVAAQGTRSQMFRLNTGSYPSWLSLAEGQNVDEDECFPSQIIKLTSVPWESPIFLFLLKNNNKDSALSSLWPLSRALFKVEGN